MTPAARVSRLLARADGDPASRRAALGASSSVLEKLDPSVAASLEARRTRMRAVR